MNDALAHLDAAMLRRAATACRNFKQQGHGRTDWFDWVPAYLDQVADRLDGGVRPEPESGADLNVEPVDA